MNWIDILLIVLFVIAVVSGFRRGFIAGSLDLITWAGSFIVGFLFYPHTARFLEKMFTSLGAWLLPVAFLITLLIARVILGFISSRIIRAIPEEARHNTVNKFLGILPGAINGWICAVILSALFLSLPLKDGITQEARDSNLANTLGVQSEWANKKLAPVFDEAVRKTMNSLTVHPSSHETIDLHFKYDNPQVRPFLETQMLELVNKERAKEGLKPLKADPELARVARAHSKDMFAKGYFAHQSLDNKSPFDRMRASGVKFKTAGENLALAQTLEIAHINLMNSPGHRANIMNPNFGRLGIGVLDGGFYGLMISQEFRD
jgi:uncharacterized protein YkwD